MQLKTICPSRTCLLFPHITDPYPLWSIGGTWLVLPLIDQGWRADWILSFRGWGGCPQKNQRLSRRPSKKRLMVLVRSLERSSGIPLKGNRKRITTTNGQGNSLTPASYCLFFIYSFYYSFIVLLYVTDSSRVVDEFVKGWWHIHQGVLTSLARGNDIFNKRLLLLVNHQLSFHVKYNNYPFHHQFYFCVFCCATHQLINLFSVIYKVILGSFSKLFFFIEKAEKVWNIHKKSFPLPPK